MAALSLLPKHLLSRLAGRAAALRWPRRLRPAVMRRFGRAFGVDFSEVRDPLESFASVQDFFVRALADGARPVDPAPDAVVSPCDGAWGASGTVENGALLQVKGRPYALAELLGEGNVGRYEGGAYATFYLSPRDYHRFHMPLDAVCERTRYVPGGLWPVNRVGVEGVARLFARNERIVGFFRHGNLAFAVAAVGATMVGKVKLAFDDLETHPRCGSGVPAERRYDPPLELAKGEEWGRFEFGSTLVLVAEEGLMELDARPPGTTLRLGRRIGTLL